MKAHRLLKAFDKLSAEDQALVRAEILSKGVGAGCCSGEMKEQMAGMMKQMESVEDPMAMCMEMMRTFHEKMETAKAG